MLENITLNGEPLRNVIIADEVHKDFREARRKHAKTCISSAFRSKKSKHEEARIIMLKGKRTETLDKIISFINSSSNAHTSKDICTALKLELPVVNKYLLFLWQENIVKRSRISKKDPFVYIKTGPIIKEKVLSHWCQVLIENRQKRHRDKSYTTRIGEITRMPNTSEEETLKLLNRAIVLHATCLLTTMPWHKEHDCVKQAFIKVAEAETELYSLIKAQTY